MNQEIMALQRKLQSEGLYTGPIDGKAGPETLAAQGRIREREAMRAKSDEAKSRSDQAKSQAEAAKAQAEAATAASQAEAIKAKAASDAAKSQADAKTAEFDRKQQDANRKAIEAAVSGAIIVGGATAGVAAGKLGVAKLIDGRYVQSIETNRKEINKLGKQADAIIDGVTDEKPLSKAKRAKLLGINRAGKTLIPGRSPLGLGVVAAGSALGAFSLYRGQQQDDFITQQVFNITGALETGVAAGTIAQTLVNRSTPSTSVPVNALASIEAAGEMAKGVPDPAKKVAKKATANAKKKAKGPTPRAMASKMTKGMSEAGKTALNLGSKIAARALLPIAVGSAAYIGLTTRSEAKEAGSSEAVASAKGVAKALDNLVLFGAGEKLLSRQDSRAQQRLAIRSKGTLNMPRINVKPQGGSGIVQAHTRRSGMKLVQLKTRVQTFREMRARAK
jgi:peptidoglycan hydrolase-like protein with peptidoglycan-binding domain